MQYYENGPIAQGDMLIRMIDALPVGVVKQSPENGVYVLTHSESGHHHVVDATPAIAFFQHESNNLVAYMVVKKGQPVIKHLRPWDTHEPYQLKQGVYEIRRQIESSPEGFRRAID